MAWSLGTTIVNSISTLSVVETESSLQEKSGLVTEMYILESFFALNV